MQGRLLQRGSDRQTGSTHCCSRLAASRRSVFWGAHAAYMQCQSGWDFRRLRRSEFL